MVQGYVLCDSDGERLLVIRTEDVDLLYSVVKRMARMRDSRIRELGRALERELHGKH